MSELAWLDAAKALPVGHSTKITHNCGGGLALKIGNEPRGWRAFCFRCGYKGWEWKPTPSLDERLKELSQNLLHDDDVRDSVELPLPAVNWRDWPDDARLWFLKAGLSAADAGALGVYYHPPTNRVVWPLYEGRTLVFWQARAVGYKPGDPRPKYLSPKLKPYGLVPLYGRLEDSSELVLTEDLLSAYKVGKVKPALSLMGTALKSAALAYIFRVQPTKVQVWLDGDKPGQEAASEVIRTLASNGFKVQRIVTQRDPKLHHLQQIKEILQ